MPCCAKQRNTVYILDHPATAVDRGRISKRVQLHGGAPGAFARQDGGRDRGRYPGSMEHAGEPKYGERAGIRSQSRLRPAHPDDHGPAPPTCSSTESGSGAGRIGAFISDLSNFKSHEKWVSSTNGYRNRVEASNERSASNSVAETPS
jgi:hypothetical protein